MNARMTITTAAVATLFALGAPALGAADDGGPQESGVTQSHFARYVPPQLDDPRLSAIGGAAARAPEENQPSSANRTHLQRLIRWMAVLRF